MPAPDPITQQFLDLLAAAPAGPQLHEMPVADARALASGMSAAFPDAFEAPPADTETRIIPAGPNGALTIHIVRPKNRVPGPMPVVMYFHGGGWVLCDLSTHRRLVNEIAVGTCAAVVFPEYSLSPEVRFPVANEEAYFATRYVAENARALDLDPARIAAAGDSAGGNMATVVCMLAKERGGPAISGAALFFPVTDADFDTASYREFADGHFLTRDSMKWFWDNYLPEKGARRDPYAAVLHATEEQLRSLPPTFIATCECDVLRDEGEAFARKLIAAGVQAAGVRYIGAIHSFMTLGPLANNAATRAAIAAANAHLRQTLGAMPERSAAVAG
jgi:acetyl esterase